MANRFKDNEPKKVANSVVQENSKTTEKYKVLLRLDGALEGQIKTAAAEMGLPVTKYIELAVREKLRDN